MNRTSSIQFHVTVPATVEREDDVFVSCCPPLDVYSQGATEREALNNLVEALQLFFETSLEMGTLHQVLAECGFKQTKNKQKMQSEDVIDVPLPLLIARGHAENRAC
jgi:predicted RNase H-like HicB family nuclease